MAANKQDVYLATLVAILGLLLVASGCLLIWAKRAGFYHCLAFTVDRAAESAFKCGNYYFGVYGPQGYDIAKAERYFEQTITIDPMMPDAWHQYARIAFLRGDFQLALYRINKQFEMRGDELMAAYYIRGLILGYAGRYSEAEGDFEKFLTWDPENWAANNDLAWLYFAQGKFKETKERAEIGLAHNPGNPWLLLMHAMALFNLGDSDGAAKELALAKTSAERLTEAEWSKAYPGNDPRVAAQGLAEFKATIEKNLVLVHSAQARAE